jgi:hypothetical protein
MNNLPLKIRQINRITVDDRNFSNPGRSQIKARRRTETAGADNKHFGSANLRLTLRSQLFEQFMPGISVDILIHNFFLKIKSKCMK